MRGRIRTLDEIKREIDRLTIDRVNAYFAAIIRRGRLRL